MGKIDSVLTIVTELKTDQASMKSWQETTHERIFGGAQPGAIQYLHAADEKLAAAIEKGNKELVDALTSFKESVAKDFTAVKADVVELKTAKKVHKAYMAGGVAAGSAFGWLIKAGLLKIGIHLP